MSYRKAILPGAKLALLIPISAVLLGMNLGCKGPQPMESAAGVPASQGTVKASQGKNGNTNLSIKVKHLAPPFKVQPDATVYVVWLQQQDHPKQNIGALTLNSNLEGNLETETPFRRFSITVTPEPGGMLDHPTHEPVFTTSVDRKD